MDGALRASTPPASLSCAGFHGRPLPWLLSALCLKPLPGSSLLFSVSYPLPLSHHHLEQVTVELSGDHTPLGTGCTVFPEVPQPHVCSHHPCPRTVQPVPFLAPSNVGSPRMTLDDPPLTLTSRITLLPKHLSSFSERPSKPHLPPAATARGPGIRTPVPGAPANAAVARHLQACPKLVPHWPQWPSPSLSWTQYWCPLLVPTASAAPNTGPSCCPSWRGPRANPRVLQGR